MTYKNKIGPVIIFLLVLIPILFWFMAEPVTNRFYDRNSILTSIGQLTALAGFALFAINLILSARFAWIQPYFAGLNKIYFLHHKLGTYAFIFLLIHPTMLVVKFFLFSSASGLNFMTPSLSDLPKLYGMIALGLMFVFLALTFWIKLKYENWRWTHKFLGATFFLGALHAFLIPSDVSWYPPLKIYILCLAGIALMAHLYHSWLARWLAPRYYYQVGAIDFYPPNIWEISLEPKGAKLKHRAGQFLFVEFVAEGIKKETHPFSISASPQSNRLRIAVKSLGDFTSDLGKLQVGDKAIVEGPYGIFCHDAARPKNQIWVAGGIGISPFLGMARSLREGDDYRIELIYAVSDNKEAVFLKELTEIARRIKYLRVIPHYSKTNGYFSVDSLKQYDINTKDKSVFVCGPPLMMKDLRKQFLATGVSKVDYFSEEFQIN